MAAGDTLVTLDQRLDRLTLDTRLAERRAEVETTAAELVATDRLRADIAAPRCISG